MDIKKYFTTKNIIITVAVIGAGVAVWYFGFKKKSGYVGTSPEMGSTIAEKSPKEKVAEVLSADKMKVLESWLNDIKAGKYGMTSKGEKGDILSALYQMSPAKQKAITQEEYVKLQAILA